MIPRRFRMKGSLPSRRVRSLVESRAVRRRPPTSKACRLRDLLQAANTEDSVAKTFRNLDTRIRISSAWEVLTTPTPSHRQLRPSQLKTRTKRKRKRNRRSRTSQMMMTRAAVSTPTLTATIQMSKERRREGRNDWRRWRRRRRRNVNRKRRQTERAVLRLQVNLRWHHLQARKEEASVWLLRHPDLSRQLMFPLLNLKLLRMFKLLSSNSSRLNRMDCLIYSDHLKLHSNPINKTQDLDL